jgi:protein-tyrosine phosphatase
VTKKKSLDNTESRKDYAETSIPNLLDMVKVVAFAISEGKVAIHCHAGLGRTGVNVIKLFTAVTYDFS